MLSVLAIAVAVGMVFLSSNLFLLLLSMRDLELSGTLHTEASPWPTHVGCCHTNPYRVLAGRFQVEEPSHVQTVGWLRASHCRILGSPAARNCAGEDGVRFNSLSLVCLQGPRGCTARKHTLPGALEVSGVSQSGGAILVSLLWTGLRGKDAKDV